MNGCASIDGHGVDRSFFESDRTVKKWNHVLFFFVSNVN